MDRYKFQVEYKKQTIGTGKCKRPNRKRCKWTSIFSGVHDFSIIILERELPGQRPWYSQNQAPTHCPCFARASSKKPLKKLSTLFFTSSDLGVHFCSHLSRGFGGDFGGLTVMTFCPRKPPSPQTAKGPFGPYWGPLDTPVGPGHYRLDLPQVQSCHHVNFGPQGSNSVAAYKTDKPTIKPTDSRI